jgi:hypothetical protein
MGHPFNLMYILMPSPKRQVIVNYLGYKRKCGGRNMYHGNGIEALQSYNYNSIFSEISSLGGNSDHERKTKGTNYRREKLLQA